MKSMLIKKDVWDLAKTSPWLKQQNLGLFLKEVKKNWIVVGIAWQTILKGVNNQMAFNIIDFEDSKEI